MLFKVTCHASRDIIHTSLLHGVSLSLVPFVPMRAGRRWSTVVSITSLVIFGKQVRRACRRNVAGEDAAAPPLRDSATANR